MGLGVGVRVWVEDATAALRPAAALFGFCVLESGFIIEV